jgi:GntR family transcriptional regulator/MocR family aminotransferase
MKKSPTGFTPVIAIDRNSETPLHRQIYQAFREGIVCGRLRRGQRIPSTRALAAELHVSRFPVLNAYAQLLAEGFFTSQVGAGTVVSESLPGPVAAPGALPHTPLPPSKAGPRPLAQRASKLGPPDLSPWLLGWGAFGVGQVAVDEFPRQLWSSLVARHIRNMKGRAFHYSSQMGSENLRQAIAEYLRTARSLRCDASQIMIVSGSQQALEISARILVDPGSPVWMEEPGYGLAREVFSLAGSRLVPVPVDGEGLNVSEGIRRCRNARIVYVTPSHQFPLGYTMSASRRLQLLEWAHNAGSWIIEDDYDSEYRYESPPVASVQGIDTDARVIYVGTFSKVLFPALRLGYVVIPPDLVDHFVVYRRHMDLGIPGLYQEALAEFIREGHFARHIRKMRGLYHQRRNVLVDNIERQLGSMVEISGSEAGMHLTVLLRRGSNDREIALQAGRQGLWIWPLSNVYLGEAPSPGFILGFGSTPIEDIPPAVRKLRKLITRA